MLAPRRPKGPATVEHAGELDRVRDEPGACGLVEPVHCLGDTVEEGQVLVILEAMKMQNPLAAEGPGVVSRVHCQKGQAVAGGSVLVEIDPPESGSPEVGAAE